MFPTPLRVVAARPPIPHFWSDLLGGMGTQSVMLCPTAVSPVLIETGWRAEPVLIETGWRGKPVLIETGWPETPVQIETGRRETPVLIETG